MKSGLFIKNLCELFFQRTNHILHIKSLILMYYFIFDSHAQAMWVYGMAKALGQLAELLAPTIFHTLKHWYQYTYLGL